MILNLFLPFESFGLFSTPYQILYYIYYMQKKRTISHEDHNYNLEVVLDG